MAKTSTQSKGKPIKDLTVVVIAQRGNAFIAYDYENPAVNCESRLSHESAGSNFAIKHAEKLGIKFVRETELKSYGLRKPRGSSRIKAA